MGIITESKAPDVDSILSFLRSGKPRRASMAGDGKEKVSSSAPGLAPADRLALEKFYKHRAHTDEAVQEKAQKDSEILRDGERDTTNFEAQIGTPMRCDEIIKRLRKLNKNFIFERSKNFPDIMGIYLPDSSAEIRDGKRLRHIAGFEFGYSPEFTVYHKDEKGAKKLTRGWRGLLLILSRNGYINFTAACKAFGADTGRKSLKWQQEVKTLHRVA